MFPKKTALIVIIVPFFNVVQWKNVRSYRKKLTECHTVTTRMYQLNFMIFHLKKDPIIVTFVLFSAFYNQTVYEVMYRNDTYFTNMILDISRVPQIYLVVSTGKFVSGMVSFFIFSLSNNSKVYKIMRINVPNFIRFWLWMSKEKMWRKSEKACEENLAQFICLHAEKLLSIGVINFVKFEHPTKQFLAAILTQKFS